MNPKATLRRPGETGASTGSRDGNSPAAPERIAREGKTPSHSPRSRKERDAAVNGIRGISTRGTNLSKIHSGPVALMPEFSPDFEDVTERLNDAEAREISTVLLELSLGNEGFARFHREVLENSSLKNILHRARVTRDGAWLRVTLSGKARLIVRFVQEWRESIMSYTHLSRSVA
jgi:hypothetical protein